MGSSDYVPQVKDHVTYIDAAGRRRPATITTVTDSNTVNLRIGHYRTLTDVARATGWAATLCWERTRPGASGTSTAGGPAVGSHYISLPGTSGNYWDTPDSAALSIVGDIDLRGLVRMTDFTPAGKQTVIGKYGASGHRSYSLGFEIGGALRLAWNTDGANGLLTAVSSVVPTATDNVTDLWIRATLDVNDGATPIPNNVVKFYTSTDAATTPAANVAWVQLGATVTTAFGTAIFDSDQPVELGSIVSGTTEMMVGRLYYAEIRNGIAGTIVAAADIRSQTPGATSFVGSQGNTYTKHGTAAIV